MTIMISRLPLTSIGGAGCKLCSKRRWRTSRAALNMKKYWKKFKKQISLQNKIISKMKLCWVVYYESYWASRLSTHWAKRSMTPLNKPQNHRQIVKYKIYFLYIKSVIDKVIEPERSSEMQCWRWRQCCARKQVDWNKKKNKKQTKKIVDCSNKQIIIHWISFKLTHTLLRGVIASLLHARADAWRQAKARLVHQWQLR